MKPDSDPLRKAVGYAALRFESTEEVASVVAFVASTQAVAIEECLKIGSPWVISSR